MNHLSSRFLAALTVSSLFALGQARADFMNWSYSTSVVPPGFAVDAPGGSSNGGGAVQLTGYTNIAGGSSINALAYQTTAAAAVTFEAQNSTYTLTMTITDNSTGHSGDLTFTGSISGGLDPNHSTLVNTFATSQSMLVLDGHTYMVTLPSSVDLADPSKSQQNILATVRVDDNGPGSGGGVQPGGGGVQGVPEPASLVLGALGFSLFGAGGLRQRLRRPAPQVA